MSELAEVRARLAHAETHLDTIRQTAADFLASEPYETRMESDPKRRVRQLVFRVHAEAPPALRHILSDMVNGVRSSLDHMVYELAIISGSNPDAPGVRTQYPICLDRQRYVNARGRDLKGVDDRFASVIESKQPFQRGKVIGTRDPLAQVQWMSNLDKHRRPITRFVQMTPHPAPIAVVDLRTMPNGEFEEVRVPRGRALRDGDVLATFNNTTEFDTYLFPRASVEIAFGKDELTIDRLGYIFAYIRREVITPIELIV